MGNDRRKDEIIQAAVKIFNEKGYSAATTREIAEEAGVSNGTMFRHFKSKEELLHALPEEIIRNVLPKLLVESMEVILSEYVGKTPEETFRALVANRIKILNDNFEIFNVVIAESFFNTELREVINQKVILPIEKLIENFLQNGIESGCFRNVNPSAVSSFIVGLVLFINLKSRWTGRMMNLEQMKDELIDLIFRGITY